MCAAGQKLWRFDLGDFRAISHWREVPFSLEASKEGPGASLIHLALGHNIFFPYSVVSIWICVILGRSCRGVCSR